LSRKVYIPPFLSFIGRKPTNRQSNGGIYIEDDIIDDITEAIGKLWDAIDELHERIDNL